MAPDMLLGWRFYGEATGPFSARKIDQAPDESSPFRFMAGGLPPAHETMANFRHTLRPERQDLVGHILLYAQEVGVLHVGNSRLDGTNIHADASKRTAVSDTRLRALDSRRRPAVDEWVARTEPPEPTECPPGLVIAAAIACRHERLANLAQGKGRVGSPGPGTLCRRAGRIRSHRARAGRHSSPDRAPPSRPSTHPPVRRAMGPGPLHRSSVAPPETQPPRWLRSP